jgi:hypothetical protein
MPNVVVDMSARSRHIRDEPWHLHFWELNVPEALEYLRNPPAMLQRIGIELLADAASRLSLNHDWLSQHTDAVAADHGPIVVSNVGGGNVARDVYRVSMCAHHRDDVGRCKRALLHAPDAEQVG